MNAVAPKEDLFDATLKAAIIYDDFELAAYAAASLERAAVRADEAIEWRVQPWQLEALASSHPDPAANEAAGTDLIVLALKRVPASTDGLLNWLGDWSEHRQTTDAALLLFYVNDSDAERLRNDLEHCAQQCGVTFLGGYNIRDGRALDVIRRQWQSPWIPTVWPSLARNPLVPSHWGINE